MKWFWMLLASGALAQTPSPPPAAVSPAAASPSRNPMQDAIAKQRAAAAVQREAVRKQAEMAMQWRAFEPPAVEAAPADCSPIPEVELTPIIETAARTQQIQPKLLRAVIEQESAFRPCAVSPKGAKGLMQLMPDTAGQLGVEDPFDPRQNVEAGARFLKQLLEKYKGDLSLSLGAYNAGSSVVDQAAGVPKIAETQDYVNSIMKKIAEPRPVDTPPAGKGGQP